MTNRLEIKVCGITQLAQVHLLCDLGVHYAGFIFYKPSPRCVKGHIKAEDLKAVRGIKKVGVFVNEPPEKIFQTIEAFGLELIQLHGEESPEFCAALSTKIPVIKAFGVDETTDLKKLLTPYRHVTNQFLIDTKVKEYGGSGRKFNWELLQGISHEKPVILSGGISPNDAQLILDFVVNNPSIPIHTIDINSRFETQPGIKNMSLVQDFMQDLSV